MSNTADGLLDTARKVPYLLTENDNNAQAIILDIADEQCVVLYAITQIPAYTDIMWNYNLSPLPQPQHFPSQGLRAAYTTVLELEERLTNVSVSDEAAQLAALGPYHYSDQTSPHPK